MPKKPDNEDTEPFVVVLESLKRNSENLKNVLDTISRICDTVDNKYAANTAKIIGKIDVLQIEVKNLVNILETKQSNIDIPPPPPSGVNQLYLHLGPNTQTMKTAILRYKHWEDFQTVASKSEMIAFTYREQEKLFEADVYKNNQILAYVGDMPKIDELLKAWLSSRLAVPREKVFEGTVKTR